MQTDLFGQPVAMPKETKPVEEIRLETYVSFGIHKGKRIRELLTDDHAIAWFADKTRRPVSAEVKNAIYTAKYLTQ